jgi:hypothetical protein
MTSEAVSVPLHVIVTLVVLDAVILDVLAEVVTSDATHIHPFAACGNVIVSVVPVGLAPTTALNTCDPLAVIAGDVPKACPVVIVGAVE